jgi:hypothetical protein
MTLEYMVIRGISDDNLQSQLNLHAKDGWHVIQMILGEDKLPFLLLEAPAISEVTFSLCDDLRVGKGKLRFPGAFPFCAFPLMAPQDVTTAC